MSRYDASIRVLLDAQNAFKAIENLEKRLDKLKNEASKIQIKTVINEEKAAVQAAEKRLTSQIRLNAALERQANLLKNLTRAGVEGERENRVKELVEAGKQFKNNLNIQYAVNTALEKELQTQREINRTERAQNANSSKVLTTFKKRLELLRAVGATEAEINEVTKTRDKAIERNSRKQTDLAKESFAQLDRQLSTLERKYSAFLNPQKQAASPIGGSKTLVGSPEYLKTVQKTVDTLERQRLKESAITEELAERTRELNKQVRLRSSIREKIENVRSARVVRERSAFLQGDPQAYERPAGPGGAFRFPQADAIEAAVRQQKNYNALQEQSRKKAKANVELQYNWAKALGQRKQIAQELRDIAAKDLQAQKQAAKVEEQRLRLARRRERAAFFGKLGRKAGSRISAGIGGGLTGGAFPALFGGSAGEVVGGGLGGIAGGILGGQSGAFTGSIFGSAIGKLAEFDTRVKEINNQLGFSDEQARKVEKSFTLMGVAGIDNFQSTLTALQSTGLTLKDQVSVIQAATATTEAYGGKIDKTISALTTVFNKGKVGIADLNRIQSQGIPIQQALADKLKISRNELLNLAKDGKIQVQDLADVFIGLANEAAKAPKKGKKGFDELKDSLNNAAKAVTTLAKRLLTALKPVLMALLKDVVRLANAISDLIRIGPIGDLQRELTVGKTKDLFSFGATPDTVKGIEKRLKNISAEGLKTKDAIDAVELIVARTIKRTREFRGTAGKLAEKTIGLELNRIALEIIAAKKRLKETPQTSIEEIDTNFQFEDIDTNKAKKIQDLIAREKLKQFDLQKQISKLSMGDLEIVRQELSLLNERKLLERALVLSSTEDQKVQKAKLETLELEYYFKGLLLKQNEQELLIEQKLQKIRSQQEITGVQRGLTQELEDLRAFPTGIPFVDPFSALARQQQRRETDIFTGLQNQEDELRGQLTGIAPKDVDTLQEIDKIEKMRAAYRNLLPQIQDAEEKQLAFNTALSMVEKPIGQLLGGLRDVVAGTKSVEAAFADFLQSLADTLLQYATQMIATYIALGIARAFGLGAAASSTPIPGSMPQMTPDAVVTPTGFQGQFAGFAANGGQVDKGETHIVGERGPEVFTPTSNGSIIPGNVFAATRAAISNGTSSTNEAFAENSDAINTTNMITKERMLERERLAAIKNNPIDIRYESSVINSVEYVTAEQHRQGLTLAAERGRALTLQSLRNSPKTRKKVGV